MSRKVVRRPVKAKLKGKFDRTMTPEEQELYRLAREGQVRAEAEMVDRLVEIALQYDAERKRTDNAHKARMSSLDQKLRSFVRMMAREMDQTITWEDLDLERRLQAMKDARNS